MNCPNCNSVIDSDVSVCPECNYDLTQSSKDDTVIEIVTPDKKEFVKNILSFIKNIKLKTKVIILSALALIVALVLVVCLLPAPALKNTVVYLKDNSLYFANGKSYSTHLLSEHINPAYYDNVSVNENDSSLFYPYDNTQQGGGYILYQSKNGKYDTSGVQIAVDVLNYKTFGDENNLYYMTNNSTLYYRDESSSHKVSSSVDKYYVGENTGDVIYQTKENNVYYKKLNSDALLIAENVNILYVSDDAAGLVYAGENGTLYTRQVGSDPVILSVGVSDAKIFSQNSIYYLIKSNQTSEDVGSSSLYTLYYYDGNESYFLGENVKVIDGGLTKPVMFTRTGLSSDRYQLNIITDGRIIPVNLVYSQIIDAVVDYKAQKFYYIIGSEEENTLCYADIDFENASLKEAVKVDENVGAINRVNYSYSLTQGDKCYYFKNLNDKGFGDLYIDGTLIAENVNKSTEIYGFSENRYVFCSDIYTDSNIGTLVAFENDKVHVIGENVIDFKIVNATDVVFITCDDYNQKAGDLKVYKNNQIYFIDSSVSKIGYVTNTIKEEKAKINE